MSLLSGYQACEAARAKINLSLEVLDRLPDGYHELLSLMATVQLADQVFLSLKSAQAKRSPQGPSEGDLGWLVHSDDADVPPGPANICHKAARRFFERAGLDPTSFQLEIFIKKAIPMEAGLAGGSTDAAALLRMLWRIWKTDLAIELGLDPDRLTLQDLEALALETGADVPFCLKGGVRLSAGIGQLLSPALQAPAWPLLIAKPAASVSTAWAFETLDRDRQSGVACQKVEAEPREAQIWQKRLALENQARLADWVKNDFLEIMKEEIPAIDQTIKALARTGALAVSMTGTGSACFALYETPSQLHLAYKSLSESMTDTQLIMTRLSVEPEDLMG